MTYQLRNPHEKVTESDYHWSGCIDYFIRGRKIAEWCLSLGLQKALESPSKIRKEQQKAMEAYEAMNHAATFQVEGNTIIRRDPGEMEVEPCAKCRYIVFCKDQGTTCSVFRDFVNTGKRKARWFNVQFPDRVWEKSFIEVKPDEKLA